MDCLVGGAAMVGSENVVTAPPPSFLSSVQPLTAHELLCAPSKFTSFSAELPPLHGLRGHAGCVNKPLYLK